MSQQGFPGFAGLALMVFSVAAVAQTERPYPLERVQVAGNHQYTAAQIVTASGLIIGRPVSKPDFDAARERLLATGVFENVGCSYAPAKDAKGYDGTIDVTEVQAILPIRFEDLPVSDEQLSAFLKEKDPFYGPKIAATKPILLRYTTWINEFLAGRDFHDQVIAKVVSENPPNLEILIRPTTPHPSVALVKFNNTGDIPAQQLVRGFYSIAVGSVYTERQFRILLDNNIRPLYEAKGCLAVKFPKISTTPATDVKGLVVTIDVDQGPVYKIGKIDYTGTSVPRAQLIKLTNLTEGDPVNIEVVKAAQTAMERALHHLGYLQAQSEVKRKMQEATKTVDFTFEIESGAQYSMGQLTIVGLDIETEPPIRKMWGLVEGKPFNIDYPQRFLDRVKEDGIFENLKNTRFENKMDDKKLKVDVTLYFNK
jgi:outer membrane protein insertion porin family